MRTEHENQLREAASRLKTAGSTAYIANPHDNYVGGLFANMLGAVLYTAGVLLEQHIDQGTKK